MFTRWRERSWSLRPPWKSGFLLLLIWRSTLIITHHDECEDENQVAVDGNCNKNDENQVTLVADMEVITHDDDCEDENGENQVTLNDDDDDDCDENYENQVTFVAVMEVNTCD